MSCQRECLYIEIKPGEWYLVIEDTSAPRDSWDWREYADAYGPFPTFEKAYDYRSDNLSNPGGYNKKSYDGHYEIDEVLQKLIDKAEAPDQRTGWRMPRGW